MDWEVLEFVWGLLLVPIGYVWNKLNNITGRIEILEKRGMTIPDRQETHQDIRDATAPLDKKLNDIHEWLLGHDARELDRYGTIIKEVGEIKGELKQRSK